MYVALWLDGAGALGAWHDANAARARHSRRRGRNAGDVDAPADARDDGGADMAEVRGDDAAVPGVPSTMPAPPTPCAPASTSPASLLRRQLWRTLAAFASRHVPGAPAPSPPPLVAGKSGSYAHAPVLPLVLDDELHAARPQQWWVSSRGPRWHPSVDADPSLVPGSIAWCKAADPPVL